MQGQSYGVDSRALEQTLQEVAAKDKDGDVRATCVALISAIDSNNDEYIHKVFNAYSRRWQNPPQGKWSDFVMHTCETLRDLPIRPVPADADAEQKLTSLNIAEDTRAVTIRSAKATLSIAGESDPQIKKLAVETYTNAVGAYDVVDSNKVYDLENSKLALEQLNQGAFKELAQSDPDRARSIVEKTLNMLGSPLNDNEAAQAADLLGEATRLIECADSSSRERYVATLEKMLDNSGAGANCPQLRTAAIQNLVALNSTSSLDTIRSHITHLPTITVNGKQQQGGEDDAQVRQAAIQALVQLHDPGLKAGLDTQNADELEHNEPDPAVRRTLQDLKSAYNPQLNPSHIADPIFSEKYKELESFSKDTHAMTAFLSGEFSKLLAKQPENYAMPYGASTSPSEVANWKHDEEKQWKKLSELAANVDSDEQGGSMHSATSKSDQAKIVLYEMIQGAISPSKQTKEDLADRDWQVQEKAAQALAEACGTGGGNERSFRLTDRKLPGTS